MGKRHIFLPGSVLSIMYWREGFGKEIFMELVFASTDKVSFVYECMGIRKEDEL